jgi:hypothetical protein
MEFHGIWFHRERTDSLDVCPDSLRGIIPSTQQVEIAGRPIGLIRPKSEERGPFENEALARL